MALPATYDFSGTHYSAGTFTTAAGSATEFSQSGGQLHGLAGGGSGEAAAYWTPDTPANDQYARLTYQAHTSNSFAYMGPAVRMNTANGSCYAFRYDNQQPIRHLVRVDSGTPTVVWSDANTLTPGDVMEVRAVGTTISCWVNGVEIVAARTTDATYSSGRGGISTRNSIDNMAYDNFEVGNVGGSPSYNLKSQLMLSGLGA